MQMACSDWFIALFSPIVIGNENILVTNQSLIKAKATQLNDVPHKSNLLKDRLVLCFSGYVECVKWLVANRAKVDVVDSNGRTPLDIAEVNLAVSMF